MLVWLRGPPPRGKSSARTVKRALALLKAAAGLVNRALAAALAISPRTVASGRTRFVTAGLTSALDERPRPGPRRKLAGRPEAHLVAIACSDPLAGHTSWPRQLLADKVSAQGCYTALEGTQDMSKLEKHISFDEFAANLSAVFERVVCDQEVVVVERDGTAVLLQPAPEAAPRQRRAKSKADYEAFLSSFGAWKDVDTDKLIKEIYEQRKRCTRPPSWSTATSSGGCFSA